MQLRKSTLILEKDVSCTYVLPLQLGDKGKSRGLFDCTTVTLVQLHQMLPLDLLTIDLWKQSINYRIGLVCTVQVETTRPQVPFLLCQALRTVLSRCGGSEKKYTNCFMSNGLTTLCTSCFPAWCSLKRRRFVDAPSQVKAITFSPQRSSLETASQKGSNRRSPVTEVQGNCA